MLRTQALIRKAVVGLHSGTMSMGARMNPDEGFSVKQKARIITNTTAYPTSTALGQWQTTTTTLNVLPPCGNLNVLFSFRSSSQILVPVHFMDYALSNIDVLILL